MPVTIPLRVLIVDDNDEAGVSMATLINRLGHVAEVAAGGESALQKAPSLHPDVMFIDLAMPEVDGFSLARQLRGMPEFVETPLIAVSGFVDAEHRAQATAAGFTGFLPKPYSPPALLDTLERVQARIENSRTMVAQMRAVAAQARAKNEASRRALDEYWPTRYRASVESPITCPSCGDIMHQHRLPEPERGGKEQPKPIRAGYRCGQCGRLYLDPASDDREGQRP